MLLEGESNSVICGVRCPQCIFVLGFGGGGGGSKYDVYVFNGRNFFFWLAGLGRGRGSDICCGMKRLKITEYTSIKYYIGIPLNGYLQ